MSDRRLWLIPIALLGAPVIAAQDTTIVRLRREADSLAGEWRRANVLAQVADSLERERTAGGRDTVAVGALRIITNRSPLPFREAAERVWPLIDSLYGPVAQGLVNRPYFITAVDPDTTVSRRPVHVGFEIPWNLDEGDLESLLLTNVPIPPADRILENWLGGPLRPRPRIGRDFGRVYVRLVTAPSESARRCFLGDIPSCRSVLEVDESPDSFLQWYSSPIERRAVLQTALADYFSRPASTATWRDCMSGNDRACIQLLRTLPPNVIPRPLDIDAHRLLAHTALRLGGREAYARLLADSGAALSRRLAAAAGVGVDSLLSYWHAEVIAARPTPVTLPPAGIPAALGWILLLAACGLRSSRWRVR